MAKLKQLMPAVLVTLVEREIRDFEIYWIMVNFYASNGELEVAAVRMDSAKLTPSSYVDIDGHWVPHAARERTSTPSRCS